MMISGRAARLLLRQTGMSDRQARLVLEAGLAGPTQRSAAQHSYDLDTVRALVRRPALGEAELITLCPGGWFIARRNDVLGATTTAQRMEILSEGWERLSLYTRVTMMLQLRKDGPLPFIATIAGYVHFGADLVGLDGPYLELGPPGPWYDALRDARLPTGPGRPWQVRLASAKPHVQMHLVPQVRSSRHRCRRSTGGRSPA